MIERTPVRVRGASARLVTLLKTPGLDITPNTAEEGPDAQFQVMGYATADAIEVIKAGGFEVDRITPVEAQPFEVAAARARPEQRFVGITGTAEALRAIPRIDNLELHDHGIRRLDVNRYTIFGTASDAAIALLRERGLEVGIVGKRPER